MSQKQTLYKNRYEDEFTFTEDVDGNVLWEGDFMYCRFGMPNDYTKSYNKYVEDGGTLSIEDFKSAIHEFDTEKGYAFDYKYRSLIESSKDKIDMVDPSGGPYISVGMNLDSFGFKGYEVFDFKKIETGYKIITKK
jgi:hypothetical protein